jgi:hypothetical protein
MYPFIESQGVAVPSLGLAAVLMATQVPSDGVHLSGADLRIGDAHLPLQPDGQLLLKLRSGFELRLGEPSDLRLKLAIARRALRTVPAGSTYLDVSVPGRPVAGSTVAGFNPQLSTGG